jgi:hypothetical protein
MECKLVQVPGHGPVSPDAGLKTGIISSTRNKYVNAACAYRYCWPVPGHDYVISLQDVPHPSTASLTAPTH